MSFTVSDRLASLKPSAIREIFKVLQDPTVISFAGGNPAPETFPAEELAEIAARAVRDNPSLSLQYGITEGHPPLREATAARLREKYNVGGPDDDLIITTGGQQGIELCTKALVNEGDTVLCENPSFIGALNAFRSYKANLVGVPVDAQGVCPDALEEALKTAPRIKLVYLIPTFQNPSGVTLTLERRKKVLTLCERYGVMLIEDNPYFELRYSGEYVPPIKSMDDGGHVLYVGSFSKVISPGLRVGFACGPKALIQKMVTAKQVSDVHTPPLNQLMVHDYLQSGRLDANIDRARDLYRRRRDLMAALLTEQLGGRLDFVLPDGGLFLWARLTGGADGMALARAAGPHKVAVVPGSAFAPDESAVVPAMRLNFSFANEEQIREGVKRLAAAMDEVYSVNS